MADFNSPDGDFLDEETGSLNEAGVGQVNSTDMEAEAFTEFGATFTSESSLSAGVFEPPPSFSASFTAESSASAGTFSASGTPIYERIRFTRVDHRAAAIGRIVWQLRQGYNPLELELLPSGARTGEAMTSAGTFS